MASRQPPTRKKSVSERVADIEQQERRNPTSALASNLMPTRGETKKQNKTKAEEPPEDIFSALIEMAQDENEMGSPYGSLALNIPLNTLMKYLDPFLEVFNIKMKMRKGKMRPFHGEMLIKKVDRKGDLGEGFTFGESMNSIAGGDPFMIFSGYGGEDTDLMGGNMEGELTRLGLLYYYGTNKDRDFEKPNNTSQPDEMMRAIDKYGDAIKRKDGYEDYMEALEVIFETFVDVADIEDLFGPDDMDIDMAPQFSSLAPITDFFHWLAYTIKDVIGDPDLIERKETFLPANHPYLRFLNQLLQSINVILNRKNKIINKLVKKYGAENIMNAYNEKIEGVGTEEETWSYPVNVMSMLVLAENEAGEKEFEKFMKDYLKSTRQVQSEEEKGAEEPQEEQIFTRAELVKMKVAELRTIFKDKFGGQPYARPRDANETTKQYRLKGEQRTTDETRSKVQMNKGQLIEGILEAQGKITMLTKGFVEG